MKIDSELIAYLEELAKLRLSKEEEEEMIGSLERILVYIDTLSMLDTEGVEALSHPFPSVNAFREDVVTPSFDREQILLGAPKSKDGCFQVPKTVE